MVTCDKCQKQATWRIHGRSQGGGQRNAYTCEEHIEAVREELQDSINRGEQAAGLNLGSLYGQLQVLPFSA